MLNTKKNAKRTNIGKKRTNNTRKQISKTHNRKTRNSNRKQTTKQSTIYNTRKNNKKSQKGGLSFFKRTSLINKLAKTIIKNCGKVENDGTKLKLIQKVLVKYNYEYIENKNYESLTDDLKKLFNNCNNYNNKKDLKLEIGNILQNNIISVKGLSNFGIFGLAMMS